MGGSVVKGEGAGALHVKEAIISLPVNVGNLVFASLVSGNWGLGSPNEAQCRNEVYIQCSVLKATSPGVSRLSFEPEL
jgi:hypothetical protein